MESKLIDISKSSIVGLKAELLKKQEEVKRLKGLQQSYIKPEIIQKKKSIQEKSNNGIEKRIAKDIEAVEEDYDAIQKSREVLEAKARLYDKLKDNKDDKQKKSEYLIDFDLKRSIDKEDESNSKQEEEAKLSESEEEFSDSNSDPENDWVDFVDTLGRSRRCLRKDLDDMRTKDAKLAATIRPSSPLPSSDKTPAQTPTPELLSWDMQRELMRQKWEEQEKTLLGKKDIHYQDVRFDEARPHGVGYYEFSTDEAERVRQQEELQALRTQTQQQQEAAQGLRMRREQQMQARLAAARRRRRERLGLPPESPPHEVETPTIEEDQKKSTEEESIVELEESVKKIAPIRPWDIGKNSQSPVMSQEEWIENKRLERPEEFAPPSCLRETKSPSPTSEQKTQRNLNFFTSKKINQIPLPSQKLKKKHKKSKSKKASKEKVYDQNEGDEEETFGPSVKDWQSSVACDAVPTDSCCNTLQESSGASLHGVKPTMMDIDLLLAKSRANVSQPSEEIIQNIKSLQPLLETKNLEYEHSRSADVNTNTVKNSFHSEPGNHSVFKKKNDKDFYKRNSTLNEYESSENIINPIVNLLDLPSDGEEGETAEHGCEAKADKWKSNKRKFAEIPPPPSMSYHINVDKKSLCNSSTKPELAASISAGISYLKSQTEVKSKKRLKGMLDII